MIITYLYTNSFSTVGGLQRFSQIFLKALLEIYDDIEVNVNSCSLSDRRVDLSPIPNTKQYTAQGNKFKFLIKAFYTSRGANKVIVSHINLLFPLVILLRLFSPKSEVILIAHGIEVWSKMAVFKRWSLRRCHSVLAVSSFTKQKMVEMHGLDPERIVVLANAIDPSFQPRLRREKPKHLLQKLNLKGDEKIIFTFAKIESLNRGKGYDRVLNALPKILQKFPNTYFILAGKAQDPQENQRLIELANTLQINKHVCFAMQLPENEIANYYSLCDVFVLPSIKEGFGIVFLEAIASGKIVIAGNIDGSKDALLGGKLGILINPLDEKELVNAIFNVFENNVPEQLLDKEFLQKNVYKEFGFEAYCRKLKAILDGHIETHMELKSKGLEVSKIG